MASKLARLVVDFGNQFKNSVDQIVFEETGLLRDDVVVGWPVDRGVSRSGWSFPEKVGEAHYKISNPYLYSAVIEYGGYPGVGPKTERVGASVLEGGIQINAGIYPKQRPAAPVRRGLSKRWLSLTRKIQGQAIRQSGFGGPGGRGTSTAFTRGRR